MQKSDYILRREIKISNIVCTADLRQPVDIASFNKYKFLSSNLDLYRCGYVKNDEMIGRVTVFASGKLISAGTKAPEQAYRELKKASEILHKYNLIKSYKIVPKIQNMAATAFLGKSVNLNNLANRLPRGIYEPEQFPGIIYRIKGSVVSLIFSSGKLVIVGAKNLEELNAAFFEVMQRVQKYEQLLFAERSNN